MKITAKGNSAWLVLTGRDNPVIIRARDIHAVEPFDEGSGVYLSSSNRFFWVKEHYIDILRALEVNILLAQIEPQADDITQGS